jgi:hypothetical protein
MTLVNPGLALMQAETCNRVDIGYESNYSITLLVLLPLQKIWGSKNFTN